MKTSMQCIWSFAIGPCFRSNSGLQTRRKHACVKNRLLTNHGAATGLTHMGKRVFTPSEERGLTDEQKAYLNAHPHIVSLQPNSMLPPREQLYKTLLHGAVTIARAMELDALLERGQVTARAVAFDNYSDAEGRFIDRHGMSSGLS